MRLTFIILLVLTSLNSFSQDYKVKDGGNDSITINFWGNTARGDYNGQYLKHLNNKKGFWAHGKGSLNSSLNNQFVSYDGDFFEGKITGYGTLQGGDWLYVGGLVDGLAFGDGELSYNLGSVDGIRSIKGAFKDGKANGKVVIEYVSGNIYIGEAVDGQLFGQGKMIYNDRIKNYNYYEGNWKNNIWEGTGTIFYQNGEKKEGLWRNNLFNGNATITFSDGSLYEGEWKDGEFYGKGKITHKNGTHLEGDFNESGFNGKGTCYYSDIQGKYIGQFINSIQEGEGIMTYDNGEIRSGLFSNNKLINGEKKLSNGRIEIGFWDKNGNFKGNTKRISGNQSIWDGEWENQIPINKGKVIFQNGDIYEGEWSGFEKNDFYYWQINGQGKMIYKNGDIYEGKFKNDELSGNGKMIYKNGNVYSGNWLGSKPNGFGNMIYSNGKVETGSFEDGDIISELKFNNQVWMKNNLKVSNFSNGDLIKQAKTAEEWAEAAKNHQPIWCYANILINDNVQFNFTREEDAKKLGKFYNWYAVNDSRGLAPSGWHIPSNNEFNTLISFLQGNVYDPNRQNTEAAQKLIGLNYDKSNYYINEWGRVSYHGGWWCSTPYNHNDDSSQPTSAYNCSLLIWGKAPTFDMSSVEVNAGSRSLGEGLFVRCIKD
jgi:uncharacterized protein (TIGR02145 family)